MNPFREGDVWLADADNEGATWTRIDDDRHRYGGVSRIVADTRVYGRVFMAGRGMLYTE